MPGRTRASSPRPRRREEDDVEELKAPKSQALRDMYWRSEILQVMYWLRGEGLGDVVDAQVLERFLGVDADVSTRYLDRMVEEGYLQYSDFGYELSERGVEEGAAEFAASFSEMTRPAHGDCSPDCWCKVSPEEAEACAHERGEHAHAHAHDHVEH